MKPTQNDIEMFNTFAESAQGELLVGYLERLQAHICDSRSWSEGETKEHANKTARIIQENLIDCIRLNKVIKENPPYQYV